MDEYDSARSCDLYLIVLVAAGFDFWLHPEVAAAQTKASSGWAGLGPGEKERGDLGAAFLFLYFLKTFFIEIYFQFHILQFYTPTARQRGGRDLHVNKYIFFTRRPLAGSCRPPT